MLKQESERYIPVVVLLNSSSTYIYNMDYPAVVCGICVCCHAIYSGRRCGRTSRGHIGGRSHRIFPPSFCGAYLNFYREKDSAFPFPPSTVKSNFVDPRSDRSPLVGHDCLFLFLFFLRKDPSLCDCIEIRLVS